MGNISGKDRYFRRIRRIGEEESDLQGVDLHRFARGRRRRRIGFAGEEESSVERGRFAQDLLWFGISRNQNTHFQPNFLSHEPPSDTINLRQEVLFSPQEAARVHIRAPKLLRHCLRCHKWYRDNNWVVVICYIVLSVAL